MSLSAMMIHTADVYAKSDGTRDADGKKLPSYAATVSDLPCFVQPAPSRILDAYMQSDEDVSEVMFHVNDAITVSVEDRVVFNSINYRVVGQRDNLHLGEVYRLDLVKEQS